MAGIYIHIPFCKQACNYCDFHFSTTLNKKSALVECLIKEIELRKDYLDNESISTIYFGGGTHSLLSQTELDSILNSVHKNFQIDDNAEITMEVNPDDISISKLEEFKKSSINRLSIGIQSFHDIDLQYMNRAHTSNEAIVAIRNAKQVGLENITIDLIYGVPTLSDEAWNHNLLTFASLDIPHLSAYCLTVESNTPLASLISKGKSDPVSDKKGKTHFEMLMNFMDENSYTQYEISNFCKTNHESKHNSSYWKNKKYLGIGPSAHSYNGNSREWNVSNNVKYINAISRGKVNNESEILTVTEAFNEYILTSLRTIWGVNLIHIQKHFDKEYVDHLTKEADIFIRSGEILTENNTLILSRKGKMMADSISSELFKLD